MADSLTRFECALAAFDQPMRALTFDRLTSPTPCDDWDVSALVSHVVGLLDDVPELMDGRASAAALDAEPRALHADPCTAWQRASGRARNALRQRGTPGPTLARQNGDQHVEAYLDQLSFSLLVHSWDLARAVGHDDVLPRGLVTWAQRWLPPQVQTYRAVGLIGPPAAEPATTDPQPWLLAAAGRESSWTPRSAPLRRRTP